MTIRKKTTRRRYIPSNNDRSFSVLKVFVETAYNLQSFDLFFFFLNLVFCSSPVQIWPFSLHFLRFGLSLVSSSVNVCLEIIVCVENYKCWNGVIMHACCSTESRRDISLAAWIEWETQKSESFLLWVGTNEWWGRLYRIRDTLTYTKVKVSQLEEPLTSTMWSSREALLLVIPVLGGLLSSLWVWLLSCSFFLER